MELLFLFLFSGLYFCGFICSMLIMIAMLILQYSIIEGCALYLTLEKTTGDEKAIFTSAKESTCQYVEYMPLAIMLYSLGLLIYHLYPALLVMGRKEPRYTVWTKVFWGIGCVLELLLFIGACIVSVGFTRTCNQIAVAFKKSASLGCKAQITTIQWQDTSQTVPDSYKILQLAEASAWISVLIYGVISGLYTYLIFFRHRLSPRSASEPKSNSAPSRH